MTKLLTLDILMAARSRGFETRDTTLGRARFRIPNEAELSEFEQGAFTAKGEYDLKRGRAQRRRLVAMMLVDQAGNPLFATPADVEAAREIRGPIMRELYAICRELAGLNDTIEVEAKNSNGIDDDDSASN